MMLSDMGAEVLRVDRIQSVSDGASPPLADVVDRGRRSCAIDLKHPDGKNALLCLVEQADALIEGFRPGVTERLGIGPDECLARQPKLIYGRMTGWGQEGPYASAAGRDINYIALSGTLAMIGRAGEPPVPPLNLVGDFGGGGLLLAFGIVCGIVEVARSGKGQVIDAAMVDGAALLSAMMHGLRASGKWGERGTNLLDTGAWFYEVYETADGGYISLGPIDDRSCQEMLRITGLVDNVDGGGRDSGPVGSRLVAVDEAADGRLDQNQDERRMVRSAGGHRRLLRARARPGRGRGPSSQPGARHVHRARGRGSACTGAAIQPHRPGDRRSSARSRSAHGARRCWTGASRPTRSRDCGRSRRSADDCPVRRDE